MHKKLLGFKQTFLIVPKMLIIVGILGTIIMNIGAGKSIAFNSQYIALDVGTCFSWIVFLVSDITVKKYGPKHAIRLSVICLLANLAICIVFWIISIIPGYWSASYDFVGEINESINATFAGNWYITSISSIAFITSAVINALVNNAISRKTQNTIGGFIISAWASTIIGQFVDNAIFTFFVSYLIFDWSITQCIACIIIQVIVEWMFEGIFTVFAYKIYISSAPEGDDDIEK